MWGIASAWLLIFYHTHISVFLFLARFPRLIRRSQRSGGTFSLLQNATQQHDCSVLCWYHYQCTPHLQRWNSLVHSVVGCQQVKLSECQPLCTCCKLHLDENGGLKPWHSLLLFASPRCSSLNSNTRACCLPRFSRYSPGHHTHCLSVQNHNRNKTSKEGQQKRASLQAGLFSPLSSCTVTSFVISVVC